MSIARASTYYLMNNIVYYCYVECVCVRDGFNSTQPNKQCKPSFHWSETIIYLYVSIKTRDYFPSWLYPRNPRVSNTAVNKSLVHIYHTYNTLCEVLQPNAYDVNIKGINVDLVCVRFVYLNNRPTYVSSDAYQRK